VLSSAADEASPADFWAHYNIVSYKYLLKYLGARYQSVGAVCDSQFRQSRTAGDFGSYDIYVVPRPSHITALSEITNLRIYASSSFPRATVYCFHLVMGKVNKNCSLI